MRGTAIRAFFAARREVVSPGYFDRRGRPQSFTVFIARRSGRRLRFQPFEPPGPR